VVVVVVVVVLIHVCWWCVHNFWYWFWALARAAWELGLCLHHLDDLDAKLSLHAFVWCRNYRNWPLQSSGCFPGWYATYMLAPSDNKNMCNMCMSSAGSTVAHCPGAELLIAIIAMVAVAGQQQQQQQ
jgi:hypothetical protein